MALISAYTFEAYQNLLIKRPGIFNILGIDFLIDDQLKVYLLELNYNPSLTRES